MKMTTSWAVASAAVVAILVAGCTTETTDTSEGGVTTGAAGGEMAGAAGAGTGGDTSTGGGGTGGSGNTDAGPEVMSACETCAYAKCKTEADACEADKAGCGAEVDKFYTCISKPAANETDCAASFVSDANKTDGGGSLANDLGSCMVDTMGCLETCQGGSGTDAGTD